MGPPRSKSHSSKPLIWPTHHDTDEVEARMPGHDHMGHTASTHGVPTLNIALFVWILVFWRQGPMWLRLDFYLAEAGFEFPILLSLSPKY